ncbi:hypothetical protein [Sphingomonas sp. NIBR02145]|uniref:hypothetical protein n=1 Tax=Sphingomonas sp. NIBR02145 TaxID=3014784 RepID=UPI0022B2D714|nr:hypothetical protein [Sphingomonas sp. NIBR02145]WHU00926.1 hypothetical protein O3305_11910 [Sphingomonas sp. NIBR02145]
MSDDEIVTSQLEFFAKNSSGCAFAAMAAREPEKYEWAHQIVNQGSLPDLDSIIDKAIEDPAISTLSLVFPHVTDLDALSSLLPALQGERIYLHDLHDTAENRCYRFRARIGEDESFISGFGPYEHLPMTRRTPYTSIVMRVKPRPHYEWHMQPPEEGIIHVADMTMKGLPGRNFKRMWRNTFLTVAGILGQKPDDESAAKTTFIMPLDRAAHISL